MSSQWEELRALHWMVVDEPELRMAVRPTNADTLLLFCQRDVDVSPQIFSINRTELPFLIVQLQHAQLLLDDTAEAQLERVSAQAAYDVITRTKARAV